MPMSLSCKMSSFKHTGGYFCPLALPGSPSVRLRHQINQEEGNAFIMAWTGSAEMPTAGRLDSIYSSASTLNIDQSCHVNYQSNVTEETSVLRGQSGDAEGNILRVLADLKYVCSSQKGETGRVWLICVFTADTNTS